MRLASGDVMSHKGLRALRPLETTMTTYRVHYPLITRDAHRDFTSKEEANRFFYAMRNRTSPHLTMNSWRHVRMVAIYDEPAAEAPEYYYVGFNDRWSYVAGLEAAYQRLAEY